GAPERPRTASSHASCPGTRSAVRVTSTRSRPIVASCGCVATPEAIGVSWARAAQSGSFHAWDPPPRVEPRFVREEVDALVGLAREHDAAWGRWFSDRAIAPLELRFDDVVADPSAAASRVLAHLGLPDQPAVVRTDPSPPSD